MAIIIITRGQLLVKRKRRDRYIKPRKDKRFSVMVNRNSLIIVNMYITTVSHYL